MNIRHTTYGYPSLEVHKRNTYALSVRAKSVAKQLIARPRKNHFGASNVATPRDERSEFFVVHPARFELTTFGSASQRSIQLSYGCSFGAPLK